MKKNNLRTENKYQAMETFFWAGSENRTNLKVQLQKLTADSFREQWLLKSQQGFIQDPSVWIIFTKITDVSWDSGLVITFPDGLSAMLSCFSRVWLCVTPWTVAHQAPLSMGFSRQEYWSRLPFPLPEDLPDPGIEPTSLTSPTFAGGSLPLVPPGKTLQIYNRE